MLLISLQTDKARTTKATSQKVTLLFRTRGCHNDGAIDSHHPHGNVTYDLQVWNESGLCAVDNSEEKQNVLRLRERKWMKTWRKEGKRCFILWVCVCVCVMEMIGLPFWTRRALSFYCAKATQRRFNSKGKKKVQCAVWTTPAAFTLLARKTTAAFVWTTKRSQMLWYGSHRRFAAPRMMTRIIHQGPVTVNALCYCTQRVETN